jgi:hypothetical protein
VSRTRRERRAFEKRRRRERALRKATNERKGGTFHHQRWGYLLGGAWRGQR